MNLSEPKSCRCFFEKWHFHHLPDKYSWNIKVINILVLCASCCFCGFPHWYLIQSSPQISESPHVTEEIDNRVWSFHWTSMKSSLFQAYWCHFSEHISPCICQHVCVFVKRVVINTTFLAGSFKCPFSYRFPLRFTDFMK